MRNFGHTFEQYVKQVAIPDTCNVTGEWAVVGNWLTSACLISPPNVKPVVKIGLADFWAEVPAFQRAVEPMAVEQQHARGSPPTTHRAHTASPYAGASGSDSSSMGSSSPGPMLSTSQIAAALSKLKSSAPPM